MIDIIPLCLQEHISLILNSSGNLPLEQRSHFVDRFFMEV
jgi:hypothetical protein